LNFCEEPKEYSKFHGIIDLASEIYDIYEANDFGIEKTFSANVLAPYMLFTNLLASTRYCGGARILRIFSTLMLTVK
jgi:hypothetical protein